MTNPANRAAVRRGGTLASPGKHAISLSFRSFAPSPSDPHCSVAASAQHSSVLLVSSFVRDMTPMTRDTAAPAWLYAASAKR